MDRAPFPAGTQLHRLLGRTLAAAILGSAAAAVHASGDGLAISGYAAWAAIAEHPYSWTPTVYDPSRRSLTFRITNKPSWAKFSSTTGQLSGTPPYVIRTYSNIVISVTDGVSTASHPAFSISVYPPTTVDNKPLLSGTPPTSVTAGTTYSFQPSARDVYGEPLSFSVKNKPAWATFSIVTGRLSGTPRASQAGAYDNVVISASNRTSTGSLPAFNIRVTTLGPTGGPQPGTAQLTWVLPSRNTNGSRLTDLAGIRIYYGTSETNLADSVEVSGNTTTSHIVTGLGPGTWYFRARAYTTTGLESSLSPIVSKIIP